MEVSTGILMKDNEVSETIDQAVHDRLAGQSLQEVLDSLRGWLAHERSQREAWFEVEDQEMYAYHRGYERGLERGIVAIEKVLKAANMDLK